jgi:hypothetical protein
MEKIHLKLSKSSLWRRLPVTTNSLEILQKKAEDKAGAAFQGMDRSNIEHAVEDINRR